MTTVKALKLGSGEELVAEIISEEGNEVVFKNPLGVLMQRTEKGPVLGFIPWMQAADGPFTINKDKIVIMVEVAQEVKNGYNQIFGAGIVVPPKDLILG